MMVSKVRAAFFGHHKSGTRYIGNIAADLCSALGLKYATANNPKWFSFDLVRKVNQEQVDFLNYMNAEIGYVRSLMNFRAFHVIRDPRDIAISAYFSHLYSHSTDWWPELVEHRERLRSMSFDDGLLLDLEFTDRLPTDGHDITVFRAMNEWDYELRCILELKFEDMIPNVGGVLLRAFDFVGLETETNDRNRGLLLRAIDNNAFSKLSGGRAPGEEDVRHHYRCGVAGDWKRYFSRRHKDWFKSRYPTLLIKTGYESDDSW